MHVLFLRNRYKESITITYAFSKVLNESKYKPNKIWADKHR